MEEIARSGQRYPNQGGGGGGSNYPDQRDKRNPDDYTRGERVAYPSTSYRAQNTNLFRVSIPSNWSAVSSDQGSVSYAPSGASGSQGITHGVMFSVAQTQNRDLQGATREVISGLMQGGNSYLRQQSGNQRTTLGGRNAIATTLAGRSPLTGRDESVTIVVTSLGNGQVFYMAAVAPSDEFGSYQRSFNDIMRSLQLNTR